MSNVGYNTFNISKNNTIFRVKNIAESNKTVNVFKYPIPKGKDRDLMKIPFVSEADIRHSLLKGELLVKLLARELIVIESNIDLLQFSTEQKQFLKSVGITKGLEVEIENLAVNKKEDIQLIGNVNSVNTVFYIPDESFIQNDNYKIIVYKNGVKQVYLDDYFIAESGGPGSGYDTVIFSVAPEDNYSPIDIITADYYIDNPI